MDELNNVARVSGKGKVELKHTGKWKIPTFVLKYEKQAPSVTHD